jgi:predicted Zn finger-like uncharacterized protein
VIINCPSCKSKYKFDDAKLEGKSSKKVKCPKCKAIIEVASPSATAENVDAVASVPGAKAPSTARFQRDGLIAEAMAADVAESSLKMPASRRFSIAVIQGNNSGEIFQITKPRVVLGRSDSDIIVQDIEASRQHARIDIMNDRIILRDLASTNGTFVNEQKISVTALENQSEFRIGTTVLMLIITDLD